MQSAHRKTQLMSHHPSVFDNASLRAGSFQIRLSHFFLWVNAIGLTLMSSTSTANRWIRSPNAPAASLDVSLIWEDGSLQNQWFESSWSTTETLVVLVCCGAKTTKWTELLHRWSQWNSVSSVRFDHSDTHLQMRSVSIAFVSDLRNGF